MGTGDSNDKANAFIARWREGEGGAERANYALFLVELVDLLDLPHPDPAGATSEANDYVFERLVRTVDLDGNAQLGRIDLYRRGSFVLEAKQSRWKGQSKEVPFPANLSQQSDLPEADMLGRRSARRGWDVLMRNARDQAERYARALDIEHGWPPFLIVCDVGHCLELFADFSGQGKNYRQFPDRAGFRIYLDDLRSATVRDRLRAVWLDPHTLDPTRRAADVTRDIARRLALVSRSLENEGHLPETVAHFLMRCLFTMFAEDVGLLEHGSFKDLLEEASRDPTVFAPMLEDLWHTMNVGGFSPVLRRTVRRFNGKLFADATAISLKRKEIEELLAAARHRWTEVEPAIFGTLLEQALDPGERRALGAHYTPRAYVERLVIATILEPLRAEWEGLILGTVERERADNPKAAIAAVHDFHERLANLRVLDPACGTGNFLYVALTLMKQLEGEVLETLAALGGQEALALETMSVDPGNFLGLEINPRAAAIAELVLWIGYLQWHLRNGGSVADPVLRSFGNIGTGDAVLRHDGPAAGSDGPGVYLNPRRPDWPEADYIVGNPPFIGGKDIRARLGDGYATALWKAHPHINRSADFVMYWWDRAADLLGRKGTRLKRFGFVTTNSITQPFSRRVIARRLIGRPPLHLSLAIPDHPWTKVTADTAAVRIAMTVCAPGEGEGLLGRVVHEAALDSDQPRIELTERAGRINADLSVGADVTQTLPLRANTGLCSPGVKLHGAGFIVTPTQAQTLGLDEREGLARHIRPYRNGRDLTSRSRNAMVIDLLGLDETEVRRRFPEVYGHLLRTVKPERDANNRATYRDSWWTFGEPRRELRPALAGLPRYVATVETAKHRIFQFLDAAIIPDNMLVCMATDDGFHLGVLSSRYHHVWAAITGGSLEDRPRYTKSACFDPFPFPDTSEVDRRAIAALADELDETRKIVLAEQPDLTLTGLYNLRSRIAAGQPLDRAKEDERQRGRVDIIDDLHRRIDAAVARAYGWPADSADEAIVARLVALNAARVREERAGTVRWLRPAYQIARAGIERIGPQPEADAQIEAALPAAQPRKPAFPRDAIGQTAAVLRHLQSGGAITAATIASHYNQGSKAIPRIEATLAALARLGHASLENGYYRLRQAA
jgi:hypothetical protein